MNKYTFLVRVREKKKSCINFCWKIEHLIKSSLTERHNFFYFAFPLLISHSNFPDNAPSYKRAHKLTRPPPPPLPIRWLRQRSSLQSSHSQFIIFPFLLSSFFLLCVCICCWYRSHSLPIYLYRVGAFLCFFAHHSNTPDWGM